MSSIDAMPAACCDFCGQERIEPVYEVPGSAIGAVVAVCGRCGLVQSLAAKKSERKARVPSTSSDATWGNIRHGKGLRLQAVLPLLMSRVPWQEVKTVLDVGSNRGHFVKWLLAGFPHVEATGIEPDGSIVDDYRATPGLTLHVERFEHVPLRPNSFDFVYCSHTLEHADSAAAMLAGIRDALKPGGRLFLEIPNIAVLEGGDVVEEFFMDKHTFHFEHGLLLEYAAHLGFTLDGGADATDVSNITLLLSRGPVAHPGAFAPRPNHRAEESKRMIESYCRRLHANREKLVQVAARLRHLIGRQRVVFWGASRLFDALVRYGGLETDRIPYVVDEYLWNILPKVHGVEVKRPEHLKVAMPQVVVALARASEKEIVQKARSFGVKNVVTFSQLFATVE